MNEDGSQYLSVYSSDTEIDYKAILKEKHNFQSLDLIIQEMAKYKPSVSSSNSIQHERLALLNCINSLKSTLALVSKIISSIEKLNHIKSTEENNHALIFNTDNGIKQHNSSLSIAPCVYIYYDELLLTYFESLLMHSQGLLDKISIFIQKYKIYNTKDELLLFNRDIKKAIEDKKIKSATEFVVTDKMRRDKKIYFSILAGLLNDLSSKNPGDTIYQTSLNEINRHSCPLKGLIIPDGNAPTLRNKLVHEESIITSSDNVFVAYRTKKGRIIKFDSPTSDGYPPIIEATSNILKTLPELAINIISSILNDKCHCALNTKNRLEYNWNNTFVDYRKYIVDENSPNDKIKLNKFQLEKNGFVLQDFYYIKSELLL